MNKKEQTTVTNTLRAAALAGDRILRRDYHKLVAEAVRLRIVRDWAKDILNGRKCEKELREAITDAENYDVGQWSRKYPRCIKCNRKETYCSAKICPIWKKLKPAESGGKERG